MKTVIFLVMAALLLIQAPVFASDANDFSIGMSVPDSFFANKTDTATIHITNNGDAGWFKVIVFGSETWAWTPTWRLYIGQGETADVLIYISPPQDVKPKIYSFAVTVTRETTQASVERQLLVQVRQTVDAGLSNFTISCTECSGSIDISVDVQNIGTEPFTGTVTANLGGVIRSYPLQIARGAVQHIADTIDLAGFKPGEYTIMLNLSSATRQIQLSNKSFSITTVENVLYNTSTSSSIFGNFVTLSATNTGNVPTTVRLRAPITKAWWSIYSGPAPTESTETEYIWVLELAGGGHTEINYSEVFWPLPLIIIALIIVGIFAYLQQAALKVTKKAVGRTMIIPGRDIGIAVSIKNTRKTAESLVVRELIPSAFSVSATGTVKPLMRKLATGTELVWKFTNVGPGEERLIHYKIIPNVQIYGGTTLSPTMVRAKCGGRVIERSSNPLFLEGATKGVRKLPVEVEK
ncbi:MAG: hypothetical protein QW227_01420 [Candidatus Aenigmatarchaeota archaeon]|nr:hypothetical protein [Candidatus Aenigmarchaeota archaeon]